MIARTTLMTIASSLLALSAAAESGLAGKTFQIDMLTIGESSFTSSCVQFGKEGRFDMAHNALLMGWTHPYGKADEFVAVTHVSEERPRSVHLGVHGIVTTGNVLLGTSINQNGGSVGFLGSEVKRCAANRAVSTPTGQCLKNAAAASGATTRALIDCVPVPYLDAAKQLYQPPVISDQSPTGNSSLGGRSFMVTMDDIRTPATCWSFGRDGTVRTSDNADMAWAPDYLYALDSTFQAVTTNQRFARTYYGALVGGDLLDVRGINDGADRSRAAYGIGIETSRCAEN